MATADTAVMPHGDVKRDISADANGTVRNEKIAESKLEANHEEIEEAEARRILSKVDYRLVPLLSLLYLVAFIDRSNSKSSRISIRAQENK